ncbi:MAG: AbiD [Gammaproteobacteria bacterium]|jgi:abortive infection bacteriophage resistance protein|nr:AbiD [Gammaproteobacteria bacterium]
MEYQKPPLTFEEQLELLASRGLIIDNEDHALVYLRNISYYRLSAYFLPFKDGERFLPGTTFNQAVELYKFDRKLRLLVLEAIEIIEISLRAQFSSYLSHLHGAFGYLKSENFSPKFQHTVWLQRLVKATSDSTETFIAHFKNKYKTSEHLPLWMALEVISFGSLSILFKGLKGHDQQAIAKHYQVPDVVLSSWLHSLVYVRNLCAHHARLWNRTLTFKPKIPKNIVNQSRASNSSVYGLLSIIQFCLLRIDDNLDWKSRLIKLLNDHSSIPIKAMGFPIDWQKQFLWK